MMKFDSWYDTIDKIALEQWIATRPQCVRDLFREFPPGSHLMLDGKDHVVFGATESDALILTPYDAKDYDDAMRRRQWICAKHLRNGEIHLLKSH